jgi:hypothetical protein
MVVSTLVSVVGSWVAVIVLRVLSWGSRSGRVPGCDVAGEIVALGRARQTILFVRSAIACT